MPRDYPLQPWSFFSLYCRCPTSPRSTLWSVSAPSICCCEISSDFCNEMALLIRMMPTSHHTNSVQHAYRDLEADGGSDQRLVQWRLIFGQDCVRISGGFSSNRCTPSDLLLVKRVSDPSPMDFLKVLSNIPRLCYCLWYHLLGNHHSNPCHCREPIRLVVLVSMFLYSPPCMHAQPSLVFKRKSWILTPTD